MNQAGSGTLDIIVINKDTRKTMQASITVTGAVAYRSARDFGFDASHQTVTEYAPVSTITGNAFALAIPPLSAHHLVLQSIPTEVRAEELPSRDFTLSQNYPNPFNPATRLTCSVPSAARVTLSIYDLLGRHVMTAFDGILEPGVHDLAIDGSRMASGTYIARLVTPHGALSRTICLLR
jgi:hypothetical protein